MMISVILISIIVLIFIFYFDDIVQILKYYKNKQ